MNKINKLLPLGILGINILAYPLSVLAQQIPLDNYTIQYNRLSNNYPVTFNISLSADRTKWSKRSIQANSVIDMKCSNAPYVRIITRKRPLIYEVKCGARYAVEWNASKNRWELRLLTHEPK
jgi:hypothetical protein